MESLLVSELRPTPLECLMPVLQQDKYQLKTLHAEIDLFDRKLAHLLRYEAFANDADRDAAARRITLKRDQLARAARQMALNGIEFSASELPRSFRLESTAVSVEVATTLATDEAAPVARKAVRARPHPSPYASTALDSAVALEEYKRKKKKAVVAQA
jgi:hypothetical protein